MRTRSESTTKDSTMRRIFSLLLAALTLTKIEVDAATISQCDEVKRAYIGMGYSPLDVPANSMVLQGGDNLQICPAGFSCCTRDMEMQLTSHSRQKYDDRLAEATDQATRRLVTATIELHAFFTQQIEKAEKEMDEMFTKVYTVQYEQNKDVFAMFFTQLRSYYGGLDLDISQVVNQFFKDVFVRMFSLQHPQYNFEEPYLGCVGDKMESIMPFGEYPKQLERNLRQSLVAARTYIQGLAIARNVLLSTQKVQPTMSCTKANMKMNFCPHCRGLPQLKPCANYCLNVMKGCLAYHSELNLPWQRFVDAMDALSMRLKGDGAFNLESVLNPLKDQVSIAIMLYHSNSEQILHKVLDSDTGCGQPQDAPKRLKRSLPLYGEVVPYRVRDGVSLKRYVDSVKKILGEEKHLWSHNAFAGSMCSSISATTGEQCWNGEDEALYTKALVGNGLEENRKNPEVDVDPTVMDPIIIGQISQLHEINSKILNATLGETNIAWLNLQIPLPNVSSPSVGEGRAVKSDYNSWYESSGSGYYGSSDDDEDEVHFSGNGNYWRGDYWGGKLPFIPSPDGSGSGDNGLIHLLTEDSNEVIIDQPVPYIPPKAQPDNKPTENTILFQGSQERLTTTRRTIPVPPSSSNSISSNFIFIFFALLSSFIAHSKVL